MHALDALIARRNRQETSTVLSILDSCGLLPATARERAALYSHVMDAALTPEGYRGASQALVEVFLELREPDLARIALAEYEHWSAEADFYPSAPYYRGMVAACAGEWEEALTHFGGFDDDKRAGGWPPVPEIPEWYLLALVRTGRTAYARRLLAWYFFPWRMDARINNSEIYLVIAHVCAGLGYTNLAWRLLRRARVVMERRAGGRPGSEYVSVKLYETFVERYKHAEGRVWLSGETTKLAT
jgi:hypothetical protein